MDPQSSIQYLKGVGPAKAKLYEKLGVRTVRDLLYHFPRDYIDLSRPVPVRELQSGESCAVRATLVRKRPEARIRRGLSLFKLTAVDENGDELAVTFFNAKYTVEGLKLEQEYLFYGRAEGLPKPAMASPMVVDPAQLGGQPGLLPVYPLTAGLSAKSVSQNMRQALQAAKWLQDPIPPQVREEQGLCPLEEAIAAIHFPQSQEQCQRARERLIFEELFTLSLALRSIRGRERASTEVRIAPFSPGQFYASLPFEPTGAQRRAVEEICADLTKETPMNRLLQGDVGSGKTLCAAAACLAAIESGYQCAVMAPTEILARQHYDTFRSFLEPSGCGCVLLTGSMGARERRLAEERIETGGAKLCVGTHALISGGVRFHKLGLVITDEQHRFGVGQRVALQQKSENPHVLVMSATPIPRTLALIIYGDLDISVLDECPKGRQQIDTFCISTKKLPRAYNFIRGLLDEGRQAYIVCPLVSEDEEGGTDLPAAEQLAKELMEGEFRGYRVGLLHGKQRPKEKEQMMAAFKEGEIQLLICTTVIEVGVDVPNAVVMLCMSAERFGLSQLHQLRGRVGRGEHKSYCILVSDARGSLARERLSAMCRTTDGFAISETDLRLRGPGDFFGQRQHGLPQMKIADMAEDVGVLQQAQGAALGVLASDPLLRQPQHKALRLACERIIENVGQRPN
ncbi:ATP-dependent DNA helicase RecG [Provencibacterium massiliense]|uniref:ATP-dependent DNA helicase RecG n=1 Tax=Provencibacterium massiliense TaxID=1841868 RepID=UPI001FA8452C|nr:ATP-dependent DNA helicase RecG [Provencibacterium massiliense]